MREAGGYDVWKKSAGGQALPWGQLSPSGQAVLCPFARGGLENRIQKENTEREEAYIQAVLRICEKEQIDAIFPSFDSHVYVFSKNKERFETLGIVIPIPDYDAVITPLDKYRTIKAAEEVGFPCPKTFLPESEEDIRRVAIQKLGWWGSITVQTRIDSRDNTAKLMGINPRIGGGLWHRIQAGINEPLMLLKIARGEEVEPIREYPVGIILLTR